MVEKVQYSSPTILVIRYGVLRCSDTNSSRRGNGESLP